MPSKYRDHTFVDLLLAWEASTVTIRIKTSPAEVASIVVRGVVELHAPHNDSWGPSVFVYDLGVAKRLDGNVTLSIQMQSGDVLEVIGSSVEEQDPVPWTSP